MRGESTPSQSTPSERVELGLRVITALLCAIVTATPQPMIRRFWLEPGQIAILNGYLGRFGGTAAGAGRLLSKVHLGDLVRRTELIGDLSATRS